MVKSACHGIHNHHTSMATLHKNMPTMVLLTTIAEILVLQEKIFGATLLIQRKDGNIVNQLLPQSKCHSVLKDALELNAEDTEESKTKQSMDYYVCHGHPNLLTNMDIHHRNIRMMD
jgi:hypothetical protein